MDNTEIVDAEFEEIDETIDEANELQEGEELVVSADAPKTKMGLSGFLAAVSAAVSTEQITSQQARELRSQMGINQAYFTRNRVDEKKAKSKRKSQKAARKACRRGR